MRAVVDGVDPDVERVVGFEGEAGVAGEAGTAISDAVENFGYFGCTRVAGVAVSGFRDERSR